MAEKRIPDARSSNGTPLFKNPCPDCGVVRLSDKRRLGKRCVSCATAAKNKTHGLCGHPLYKKLLGMRARCEYPSATGYEYYGGAGIFVCDEWKQNPASFVEWAEVSGYAKGLEIDRIDPTGPYAPWNCRFVSHKKNSQLRTNSRCDEGRAEIVRHELDGGASVAAAAKAASVPYMTAWHISKGNTWAHA